MSKLYKSATRVRRFACVRRSGEQHCSATTRQAIYSEAGSSQPYISGKQVDNIAQNIIQISNNNVTEFAKLIKNCHHRSGLHHDSCRLSYSELQWGQ
eukprot:1181748-Prorocentrum_minimum.AAC.2